MITHRTFTDLALLTSVPNWDLENGRVIPQALWDMAELFYNEAREVPLIWEEGFISPCGDGGIHMTWNGDGRRFSIELSEDGWSRSYKNKVGGRFFQDKCTREFVMAGLLLFLGGDVQP